MRATTMLGRFGPLNLGEIHLELDHDLVAELERAEEAGVRLDPETRLSQRRAPPVPAGAGVGDLQPGRLRLAVEGDSALDGAAGPGGLGGVVPPGADSEPAGMIRDEAKLAVPPPRIPPICFLISRRSRSVSGTAPPVPSRTSSEPRSSSALTWAAAWPPSSSAGTSTCADQRVTSMVRSWPALAASPDRLVLMTTRPVSGPSRKLPVDAATGQPYGVRRDKVYCPPDVPKTNVSVPGRAGQVRAAGSRRKARGSGAGRAAAARWRRRPSG